MKNELENNEDARHILMVDNDSAFLGEWTTAIERAGYSVSTAGSREEVEAFFASRWAQAMIVDVRLLDDDDDTDKSGLSLALDERYRMIPKVILTGFEDWRDSRKAMGQNDERFARMIYVTKKEGSGILLEALEQLFVDQSYSKKLVIRWKESLSAFAILGFLLPATTQPNIKEMEEELRDLLNKLCEMGQQITINHLMAHRKGMVTLAINTLTAQGTRPMVAKLGHSEVLAKDLEMFSRYVGQNTHRTNLIKIKEVHSIHFSAVCYEIPGVDLDRLISLKRFYYSATAKNFCSTIERIFDVNLSSFYQGGRSLQSTSPEPLVKALSLNQSVEVQSLKTTYLHEIANQLLRENLAILEVGLDEILFRPEPTAGVERMPNPIPYFNCGQIQPKGQLLWGMTFGLSSGYQILTDGNGDCWLIDFGNCDKGPLLRDFVGLESTLKTDFLREKDTYQRFNYEKQLTDVGSLDDSLDLKNASDSVNKAIMAVQAIRLAASAILGSDSHNYLVGLFYASMVRLSSFQPEINYTPDELLGFLQNLFSASLLCKRLSPLPPQAVSGLWINAENGEIWVEGILKELGRQEKNVLTLLHAKAGQVCTRAEILSNALGSSYAGAEKGEGNRLDTVIRRLREQIEPDANAPHYIETIRGEGYILHQRTVFED